MWVAGQFQSPRKLFDTIEKRTNYLDPRIFLMFAKSLFYPVLWRLPTQILLYYRLFRPGFLKSDRPSFNNIKKKNYIRVIYLLFASNRKDWEVPLSKRPVSKDSN